MRAFRVDNQGYFVEDVLDADPETAGPDIVFEPVPQPCMTPRWDGGQWIEEDPEGLKNRAIESWRGQARVSAFQAQAALLQAGYMPDIEAIMADPSTDPIVVMAWNKATEFKRLSPTVLALSQRLGIDDAQLDALFELAETIEA